MLRRYCLHSLPECLLCSLVAVSLCVNMVEGFYMPEELYTDYARITVITVLFIAILYAICYSRRTLLIGIAALVVAAVVALMICFANGIPMIETDEPEDNAGLWYIVVLLVALVVFLLTRTVGGCIVLCVFGALANVWIVLSLYPHSVVCQILFLFSSVAMMVLCRYNRRVLHSSTHKNAFFPMLGISATAAGASVLCAVLVWFLVIAPLNPPVLDLKLINRIVSIEVLETIGVSKKQVLMDQNNTSNQLQEDYNVNSSQINDETDERNLDATEEESYNASGMQDENSSGSPEREDLLQTIGQVLTATPDFLRSINEVVLLTGLIFIILLIAAAITYLCTRHRRWLWRLSRRMDMDHQVDAIYHRMVKKMPVVGIASPGYDTPLEYARHTETQTIVLDQGGVTWKELSVIFSRLCYGKKSVTEEEYNRFVSFYRFFYKSARKLCGFRYLWRQFRI